MRVLGLMTRRAAFFTFDQAVKKRMRCLSVLRIVTNPFVGTIFEHVISAVSPGIELLPILDGLFPSDMHGNASLYNTTDVAEFFDKGGPASWMPASGAIVVEFVKFTNRLIR